jgi:hypothetical protein
VRIELHPEVGPEIRSAALWYEEQRQNLGDVFVIRKAVLPRFPYLIAFEHDADRVLVLGVVHSKRRPLYWLRRSVGGQP